MRAATDGPAATADSDRRTGGRRTGGWIHWGAGLALLLAGDAQAAAEGAAESFAARIHPILSSYCFDCHADGMSKGQVSFDEPGAEELVGDKELWLRVLKNVRAGLMPPERKEKPTPEEVAALEEWIKREAFGIDPHDPDPGKVTLRRLNRDEYRNTIRDLMGVEFDVDEEFPADDTGYGFDNIGDVLSLSPLLLEKYMQAAEKIVADAVPRVPRTMAERTISGREFRNPDGGGDAQRLNFYKPAVLERVWEAPQDGTYRVKVRLEVGGSFNFDPARARVVLRCGDKVWVDEEFGWEGGRKFEYEFEEAWPAGERRMVLEVQPLVEETVGVGELGERTFAGMRLDSIVIRGPVEPEKWGATPNYARFFHREEAPAGEAERREYAGEVLGRFARRAFRRPVDGATVERLLEVAETVWQETGARFEDGLARAMVAVLASPRFLFRVEEIDPADAGLRHARVDEHSLATRLSYFFWGTQPDERLRELAEAGRLRAELDGEVRRLLRDGRSRALVRRFVGQWLQVDDIDGIAINVRAVQRREGVRTQQRELDRDLRYAMRRETEMLFEHVLREDRDVAELIGGRYTFLNERLARHYGIDGVQGEEMRRVDLPADHVRGGLLSHGSVLVVTSNPTRTSPVKRGLFVLDNLLGTPPPPPPPDIPTLEEAEEQLGGRPTMRELMEAHRSQSLCRSCHVRMDPLGLALDNFNAMGAWREMELDQPIDASGELVTGEKVSGVQDLRQVLVTSKRADFYRCLTEKLLTYALGRGPEYYDTATIDSIVSGLEENGGRFSVLLEGIVNSAPFQKMRNGALITAQGSAGETTDPTDQEP